MVLRCHWHLRLQSRMRDRQICPHPDQLAVDLQEAKVEIWIQGKVMSPVDEVEQIELSTTKLFSEEFP